MTEEEFSRLNELKSSISSSLIVMEDDKRLEILGWVESLSDKEKEYVKTLIDSGIEWYLIDEEP